MIDPYIEKRFSKRSRVIIATADGILREYAAQGFTLTLRQLYYQFVSRDLIENTERSYKRLGGIVSDARLSGDLDWDHMTDRTRRIQTYTTWRDPQQILRSAADGFVTDWWRGQYARPEVWVEKDALIDVVAQACDPFQVPHFSCRGYASTSSIYEAGQRLTGYDDGTNDGQIPVVVYLGDHDPSGIDMTRDIRDRLNLFGCETDTVTRIALSMEQIKRFSPPPNPAKITDSRIGKYREQYGEDSWELDALEPSYLVGLIAEKIKSFIDAVVWERVQEEESEQRHKLAVHAGRFKA